MRNGGCLFSILTPSAFISSTNGAIPTCGEPPVQAAGLRSLKSTVFLAEGEAPAQAELQRIIESLFKKMGATRMPKGPKGEKGPADVIGAAVMVGRIATGEIEDADKANAPPAKPIKRPRSRPAKKS